MDIVNPIGELSSFFLAMKIKSGSRNIFQDLNIFGDFPNAKENSIDWIT